eukprot:481644_1
MSRDLLPNTPQYAKIHEFLHTLSRDTLPNIPSTHLANKFNHDHLHSLHDEGKDIVRAYRHVLCCQILNVDHTKPIESHLSSLNNCSCNTDVDTQMHALQSIATPSTYDALFQSQIRDILHQYASNPFTHATLNPLLRTYTMNAANPNQMDIDDDDEFIDAAALDDPNDPDWVPPSSIFPSDQVPRQSDHPTRSLDNPIASTKSRSTQLISNFCPLHPMDQASAANPSVNGTANNGTICQSEPSMITSMISNPSHIHPSTTTTVTR